MSNENVVHESTISRALRIVERNPRAVEERIFKGRPNIDVLDCNCVSIEKIKEIREKVRCSDPLSCIHYINGECDGTPCELCNQ